MEYEDRDQEIEVEVNSESDPGAFSAHFSRSSEHVRLSWIGGGRPLSLREGKEGGRGKWDVHNRSFHHHSLTVQRLHAASDRGRAGCCDMWIG